VNDRFCPTSGDSRNERSETDNGNCHEQFPTFGWKVNEGGAQFSPTLFANWNVNLSVFVAHSATVTQWSEVEARLRMPCIERPHRADVNNL
jgi:hypothetical protein